MGTAHRAVVNEYGLETYDAWRKSRMSLADFEKAAELYEPIGGFISQTHKEYLDGNRY